MPKHKGTDHLRAELRTRMAKLTQLAAKKSGAHRASMAIDKEGAAQIAVVGLPNAGKSQLVSSTTGASPTVAEYPFTTQSATPGMMAFENIQIQLIDTPPLTHQYIEPWLPNMIRRADGLLVVVDLSEDPLSQLEAIITKLQDMHLTILDNNPEDEQYGTLRHKKALIIGNKIDLAQSSQNYEIPQALYAEQLPFVAISARTGTGLEELRLRIYQLLDIIRVYTKVPGGKPDYNEPIILDGGSTMEDAAAEVHKDFKASLKFARVWGSGKHDGVMVKRDHILEDGDIIELHT